LNLPHCAVEESAADGRVARLRGGVGQVGQPVGEEGGEGADPGAAELVVGHGLEDAVDVEAALAVQEASAHLLQTARLPQRLRDLGLSEVAPSGNYRLPNLRKVALQKMSKYINNWFQERKIMPKRVILNEFFVEI